MHNVLLALSTLAARTAIFPLAHQLLALGKKLDLAFLMNEAAASLHYAQPLVSQVEPSWQGFQEITSGTRKSVWKRENSESSEHVLRAGMPGMTRQKFNSILAQGKLYQKYLLGIPRWQEQPLIPQLVFMGELRSVVVNGTICYTVHSLPGVAGKPDDSSVHACYLNASVIQRVRPLDRMR